jgi:hypothetical protein
MRGVAMYRKGSQSLNFAREQEDEYPLHLSNCKIVS